MQERAGVRDLADRVGRIINPTIPPVAAAFVRAQSFVVVSTVAADGSVTCSLLGGDPGFVRVPNESTLSITARYGHRQQVETDIRGTGVIGLLAIDFATRRRMRVNGVAELRDQRIVVSTREVYSNCPQYIRERSILQLEPGEISSRTTEALDDRNRRWIESAETFFIASVHPEAGADVSHRGGPPGFVKAAGNRLVWPDYPGNNMFNTLGNVVANPRCGLLFINFENGSTLQLRGTARVIGDMQRLIEVDADQVAETTAPSRSP
jgi:hypothetical protein